MKFEKVYQVEFMNYTNHMKDTVCKNINLSEGKYNLKHVHVGTEPFLVTESQLNFYSQYGGGFRSLNFIGVISVPFDVDFVEV